MELALIKLLFYRFIMIIGALVICIAAITVFLNNKIDKLKEKV